jgi:predicted permease
MIGQDIRYALRQMRKSPGFTITAIITLALGIGANTVIYTLIDSILLRPLPYPAQDRLMLVTAPGTATTYPKGWIRDLGAKSHAFSAVAGYGADAESNLSSSDKAERVFGSEVSVNTFDLLGIRPERGAFFSKSDEVAGQDRDVVISHDYWQQRFGGDASAIGQSIRIDGVWRRVTGVMPAGVHFPYADTQFVVPVSFRGDNAIEAWQFFNLHIIGRLANGVRPRQAQAELRKLHGPMLADFPWRMPDSWASNLTVTPMLEQLTGSIRPRLLLLFGAVGLILLIACANVANLMLARASAREREIAIRGALGASITRIIRQLLLESVILGVAAGVVALAGALATLRLFVGLLPADTPRLANISLHPADALFTFGASLVAGILFGIIPAIRMAAPNLLDTLRLGSRGIAGKGMKFGVARILVIAQIGLSVVVITAAGLMLRSLLNLSRVDPGFQTANTITAEVSLDSSACADRARCHLFFETLAERVSGIAGVESAGVTDTLPLGGNDNNYVYDAENHPRDAHQGALQADGRTVTPGYFKVLGLSLVRGRWLGAEDSSGSTHAVLISQGMAQHLWPNQDPIGKHLVEVADEPTPAVWNAEHAVVVVGVVGNARESSLSGAFADEVYLPLTPATQSASMAGQSASMYVLMRTHSTPTEAAAALRRAVAELDTQVPVTRVRTLGEVVAGAVEAPRALSILLLGFGSLAVIIGAIGVYSLIAYIVSWRTREFGLRLALGSSRMQIVGLVVRQSLVLAGAGSLAGLAVAASLSRAMQSFLFEVQPVDPVTYCAVPALMMLVAVFAAWNPARRAAAIEPMQALRND